MGNEKGMELEKVLHMSGGTGEFSYAETAYLANKILSMTKAIKDDAITGLISQLQDEKTLGIADLGCSCGPNTFKVVSELLITCEKFLMKSNKGSAVLEYDVHLNDLPGNDFNTVFISLPKLYQELKQKAGLEVGQFFVSATPGTFYGRLFPSQSLHFVHSSYSLYWLSRVPEGIEDNKQNIYLSSTSPTSVVQAYKGQFQRDTQMFLRSRSQELVKGGRMVLTYCGRSVDQEPTRDDNCFVWNSLNNVLNELVSEGIIEEEKVEAFNIPIYHASLREIVEEVEKEGSFFINATDVSQVNMKGPEQEEEEEEEDEGINTSNDSYMNMKGKKSYYKLSKVLRSVFDSVFTSHFGEAITDQVFQKFSNIIDEEAVKEQTFFTNVTISLTKM